MFFDLVIFLEPLQEVQLLVFVTIHLRIFTFFFSDPGLFHPSHHFFDMLSLTVLNLAEVVILAALSHIDFRIDIVQDRLSRLKCLICQVIVPTGNIELFQSCLLVHAMVPIHPVLLVHGPSLLNIVILLLLQLV